MGHIPAELKYTEEHEWIKVQDGVGTIGITDYAQHALGDIVFVELPEVGKKLEKGKTFGVVESIKSVSDLFTPVTGEVLEVHSALESSPETINQNPYESWLIKVKISNPAELKDLLSDSEYKNFCH